MNSRFTLQACTSQTAPELFILYALAPAHITAGTRVQCESGRRGEGRRSGPPGWRAGRGEWGLSEDSSSRRNERFVQSSGTKKPLLQKSLFRLTPAGHLAGWGRLAGTVPGRGHPGAGAGRRRQKSERGRAGAWSPGG